MTEIQHPDWLAVGREVEVVRRLGHSVAQRHRTVVTRHTATSVVVDGGDRFQAKWSGYHLVPKYLDYTTELRPL